jgi:tetratricopeptide (TPR) repeat protein
MARAEDIVNRMRRHLARSTEGDALVDMPLVEEYGSAVEAVNARLDRCISLLRQGLRSEAIHQAELSPPVVEEAAALDFPERGQWTASLCQLPEVNAEAVAEINEAYPREQALAKLLKAHRRLALGRAPLPARIKVLRRLSQADPDNPFWGEDLGTFEKARHQQIARMLMAQSARQDVAMLEALDQECNGEVWLEKPPTALRQALMATLQKARAADAKARMRVVQQRIISAYEAGDLETLDAVIGQWQEAAAAVGTEVEMPPEVAEANEWLTRHKNEQEAERAFRYGCLELERGLDDRLGSEEMERLWATLLRFERPIPPLLQTRYHARMSEKQLEGSRKHRLVLMGVVGAILVAAGIVWVVVSWAVDSRMEARWQSQIHAEIDQARWTEARKLLDRLAAEAPDVFAAPKMQAAVLQVDGEIKKEQDRLARFRQALSLAEAAPQDKEAMKLAASLAHAPEEKLAVERLRGVIQQAELATQKQRDAEYTQGVGVIRDRFAQVLEKISRREGDMTPALRELRHALSQLQNSQGVSPTIHVSGQALLTSIGATLASEEDSARTRQQMDTELSQVLGTFENATEYAGRLRSFAERYPTHPSSADFRRAAAMGDVWRSIYNWSRARGQMRSLRVTTAAEVTARLPIVESIFADAGSSPYRDGLLEYKTYLQRAQVALNDEKRPTAPSGEVQRLLSHRVVASLESLWSLDGKVFYFQPEKPPRVLGDHMMLPYVANGKQAFSDGQPQEKIVAKNLFRDVKPGPSPQARFAMKAQAALASSQQPWELQHSALCTMLREAADIDAVLRLTLLSELSTLVIQRDWIDDSAVRAWLNQIRNFDLDVEWLDPYDPGADAARAQAAALLNGYPDLSQSLDRLEDWEKQMSETLGPRVAVGVLVSADGRWQIMRTDTSSLTGDLEALVQDGRSYQLKRIGAMSSGAVRLDEIGAMPPGGSVVFMRDDK